MAVILALMLALMPASPIPLSIPRTHPPVVVPQEARDLERYLNVDREREHLPPLQFDEQLRAIALDWALHMANQHFFGHVDSEGRNLVDRLRDENYVYSFAAENLALNRDAQNANIALMRSPGHAANILSPVARRVGIAAVNIEPGETLFVEDFSD